MRQHARHPRLVWIRRPLGESLEEADKRLVEVVGRKRVDPDEPTRAVELRHGDDVKSPRTDPVGGVAGLALFSRPDGDTGQRETIATRREHHAADVGGVPTEELVEDGQVLVAAELLAGRVMDVDRVGDIHLASCGDVARHECREHLVGQDRRGIRLSPPQRGRGRNRGGRSGRDPGTRPPDPHG